MKRVLLLNGSFCELPLIETCHQLGYYVITTGNMPELMAHKYADEYIKADYSDYESILKIAIESNVDAVLSCANDFGSITAAYVSEKMGWKTHDSFENSKLLHHKDLFKEYIQKKGFPTPISKIFTDRQSALDFLDSADYPIIVKANDLTGGKGIKKAQNKHEAVKAIDNALCKSRSKHILIEPFVTGDQQTFVTFLHDKRVVSYGSCDSYSFVNPYLIQAETLPAKNIDTVKDALISIIESIAEDLSLADGIFALQYIRNGNKLNIIEMMRRPFGNQFLKLVEYSTNFPWHLAQVVAETGADWNLVNNIPVEHPNCGHYGVMAGRNGKLKRCHVPKDIEKHIIKKFVMKQPGDMIEDHLNERIVFLHFAYDDFQQMQGEVKDYSSKIKVELE